MLVMSRETIVIEEPHNSARISCQFTIMRGDSFDLVLTVAVPFIVDTGV